MKRILIPILVILVLLLGACGAQPTTPEAGPTPSEPEIPADYITYTDEVGLFSISYPPEWEPALSQLPEREAAMKNLVNSINSDVPIENASCLFLAGIPINGTYSPNVVIMVEPMPTEISTHEQMVEAEINGVKQIVLDYHELHRVKTIVDGREATIIEMDLTYPQIGQVYYVAMLTLIGRNVWGVGCTVYITDSFVTESSQWEKDFQAIVRSFRILK
jgi:hypothetical protein